MDKFINLSIYIIYLIIALVSIVISYRVSIIMSLIVIAIEYIRLIAIYKKIVSVVLLIFILNLSLIGYNSFKEQQLISANNIQILKTNELTNKYIDKSTLKATTFKDLKSNIQTLEKVSLDWWLVVGVYIILEISLLILVIKIKQLNIINKKYTKKKPISLLKIPKDNGTINATNSAKIPASSDTATSGNDNLEYVGNYREYAKLKGISRSNAEKIFKDFEAKGQFIIIDRKKYLKTN